MDETYDYAAAADQEDADQGDAFRLGVPSAPSSNGLQDFLAKLGLGSGSGGASAPSTIGSGFAWDRTLNGLLQTYITKEQINANKALIMAGRSVGYNPALTTINQPQSIDGLVRMALIGGLIYGVIRLASRA